ncbi:MAG: flagellar assembly protein FliX [Alphaproteobacteria bacterium]|nr:flagellar assembly protein FliX [Alphaproteobacteria bacterium]
MLKVNDINKTNELSQGKAVKKSGGGESFSAYLSETMKSASKPVGSASGISVADAIFATQMVNNEEEREIRKKLVKRGQNLIEKLEEIRDGLLIGYISKEELINISRILKENQIASSDPRLQELMAEIELRVEVELAKLTK